MVKMFCSVCGEPCRGSMCSSCIKRNKKKKYSSCMECGASVSAQYFPHRCRRCGYRAVSSKLKKSSEYITCATCGKSFKRLSRHKDGVTYYCSVQCSAASKSRIHGREHTRDKLINEITNYIMSVGRYVTREELNSVFHVSDKVYTRLNIRPQAINKSLGYTLNQQHNDNVSKLRELIKTGKYRNSSELREVMKDSYPASVKIKSLFEELGVKWSTNRDFDKLRKDIVTYIKRVGHSVTVGKLMEALHFDHKSTWVAGGFDIASLHKEADVEYNDSYSYYENSTYKALVELLGESRVERQKTFSDLKSNKRWALRYDFFIPSVNVLIEVDGEQHNPEDARNTLTLQENDEKKNRYAVDNGYILHRISTRPAKTFTDRLMKTIKEIEVLVKESELLEG